MSIVLSKMVGESQKNVYLLDNFLMDSRRMITNVRLPSPLAWVAHGKAPPGVFGMLLCPTHWSHGVGD